MVSSECIRFSPFTEKAVRRRRRSTFYCSRRLIDEYSSSYNFVLGFFFRVCVFCCCFQQSNAVQLIHMDVELIRRWESK